MGSVGKVNIPNNSFKSLDEYTYENLLPEVTGPAYTKILNVDTSNRISTTQNIELSKIHSIQGSLDKENMDNMMKLSVSEIKELGKITIYKMDNIYYVDDGNHRLAALKAKGVKSLNVNVVDLNKNRRKK